MAQGDQLAKEFGDLGDAERVRQTQENRDRVTAEQMRLDTGASAGADERHEAEQPTEDEIRRQSEEALRRMGKTPGALASGATEVQPTAIATTQAEPASSGAAKPRKRGGAAANGGERPASAAAAAPAPATAATQLPPLRADAPAAGGADLDEARAQEIVDAQFAKLAAQLRDVIRSEFAAGRSRAMPRWRVVATIVAVAIVSLIVGSHLWRGDTGWSAFGARQTAGAREVIMTCSARAGLVRHVTAHGIVCAARGGSIGWLVQ